MKASDEIESYCLHPIQMSFNQCISCHYFVWLSLLSVQKKNPKVITAIASINIIVPISFIL